MVWTKWYGQKGMDKTVWTKWYGQNGMERMVGTKFYGHNGTDKVINQPRSHSQYGIFINSASTLRFLAFLCVLIIYC